MIHHISISARTPHRVADTLARFWNAEALPFPMYDNSFIVFSGDAHGTSIEIYPSDHVLQPSTPELPALNPLQTLPASGFHAAISVPLDEQQIADICADVEWTCQVGPRGPFFHVVEVWVENHTLLELLTPNMAEEYSRFATAANWKAAFGLA